MIKFFRKIRQKLLSEGKTGKYLKYAIGEIFLVVIGILIALSINNWNQDRLNATTEKKILKEIENDLMETLKDANNDLGAHNEMLSSTFKSIQYLQQNEVHIDTLTKTLTRSFSDTRTYAKSGGMEYLKSKGLAIIKSDSLRKEITDLYELSIKRLDQSAEEYDSDIEFAPYLKSHFTITSQPVRNIKPSYLNDSIPLYRYKIKDYNKIKMDSSL
ncbi:MAG: hypothetical protein HKN83_05145, partial [Gammaproteobacteria bacterium]|nr:hypothetical protein [Gammaproteobacteria bacterium]